ncbi:hypothetical protein [Asaia prunellae]|uniref:hypothetical protein n=1 Tax=Asaia prunellae TaxID=610245 RepID=UPI000A89BF5E|nr:hypothetical protein [Asaia prunellae]
MIDMSKASFTIAYDGPALRDHSMDVRALAPALMGFGQLIDATNSVLNKDAAQTKIRVKALEAGSFQVSFEVVQSFYEQVVGLFSGPEASAASNLLGILGFSVKDAVLGGCVGVIMLLKWLRGKNPDSIRDLGNDMVRLQFGTEQYDIPLDTLRVLQSVPVRDALQKIIEEPLKQDGIERFEVRESGEPIVSIDRSEAIWFSKPELPDQILVDDRRRGAFSILSLAFKEDNKWRLHDGANTISATIADEDFIRRVNASEESFSKGDVLVCDVRLIQRRTEAGLRTDYTVERVLEHIPGARQIPLDFDT